MNRKMILAALVAVVLGFVVSVKADTTNTVTNAVGQVFTVISTSSGVYTTSFTPTTRPASASQVYLNLVGIQLDAAGTISTTNTLFTPRQIGDMLIGQEGATGKVWMATGVTTNDWQPIYDP